MLLSVEGLLAGFVIGVLVTLAAFAGTRRRRRLDENPSPAESAGTVPHTDRDAAAAIGRETGGEVFDD
jgi:hypothetical protein